jgi:arylformamidase
MIYHRISNFDAAYANVPNIPGGDRWADTLRAASDVYRTQLGGRAKLDLSYGQRPRNRFDLFMPTGTPKGLVVFIHGGYWLRYDHTHFSHLAHGAVESGFAVAMPTYTLCPEIRVAGIVAEIGAAIDCAAEMIEGPIHLTGHSAGGHLAARMICQTSPLNDAVRRRIGNTVPISGLHDLRPMMRTAMNSDLRIDAAEAMAESPALLEPTPGARLICWVGGAERSEFIRQNALLANVWTGLGAATATVVEPDRHHFSIVDGLADPDHPLTQALLAQ